MKFACTPIRWVVVSAWMAMLIATPLCAPTALFAAPPTKVAQSKQGRCPCGKNCRCLVCCCSKARPAEKHQPIPVKVDTRDLGLFDAVATFACLPAENAGLALRSAFHSLAYDAQPERTLVSQGICLRV